MKEKWDSLLPEPLLLRSFASFELDMGSIPAMIQRLLELTHDVRSTGELQGDS